MLKVLGIGDNVVDVYIHRNLMYPGGNTMNFCACARKLGHQAAYIGIFGDDRAARHVMDTARLLGIDLSHARQYPGENGRAMVDLVDGDRTFIGSNKGGVAKEHPIALQAGEIEYVRQFDLVHTSCFSYMDQELDTLRTAGVPISYDFSTHLESDRLRAVCPSLFLAIGSCSHLSDEDAYALARKMHEMGSELSLLSMGMRGAIVCDGNTVYRQDAGKEKAIDSMGAGDSFLTAFSTTYLTLLRSGRSREESIRAALQKAADFATETCMIEGGFGHGTTYQL